MSERATYEPGVPCWVDTLSPDPDAAMRFYGGIFGWEFAGPGRTPGDPPGRYFVAHLRGKEVAGVGSPAAHGSPPVWNTYIAVARLEESVKRAREAGAEVLAGPQDAAPAGRLAVLGDPAGATFCLFEPGTRHGAQLVTEPSAWSMSVLHTSDTERARAFYARAFGWTHEGLEMGGAEAALCRLPGFVGGEPEQPVPRDVVAVMMPSDENAASGAESWWSVGFWIEDADAAATRTPALGGRVITAPFDTAGFRIAVLADPVGAEFSVSTLRR